MLKVALLHWTEIDVDNPETYPPENQNVLVWADYAMCKPVIAVLIHNPVKGGYWSGAGKAGECCNGDWWCEVPKMPDCKRR